MSNSANHKNKTKYYNNIGKEKLYHDIQKVSSCKRETSKKDKSRINITTINNIFAPNNNYSISSINTNISNIKENGDDFLINSFPMKPILENDLDNDFIPKRKLNYKSPAIYNNKIISFQKPQNKGNLEFSLYDDKLVFKHINKSYLQDESNDDGEESSDEKINDGKKFLTQELEDSFKLISNSLKKGQNQKLLSRRMRFNNENNQNV